MEIGNFNGTLPNNGNGKHLPSQPLRTPTPLPDPTPDELNLRQLLSIVRRRALVIAGVAIATTSAIGFWTVSQTPKYESRFQLLVEPVTEEGNLDKLTQVPGISESPGVLDYDTQIEVLRSPNLMAPIIQEIEKSCKDSKDITYDSLINGG